MGASLLVFANKTDVGGCMTEDEIGKVQKSIPTLPGVRKNTADIFPGTAAGRNQDAQVDYPPMQCYHGTVLEGRNVMGGARRKRQTVLVLRFKSSGYGLRRYKGIATLATPRTCL